ncbi:hypothetical protein BU26DRAFT_252374 [Trematosphaeria pertusa]|uniref:Uncharacterized protein n=1 Tax=Trematosphaeria pertusa TaxID=390896 RepID=A0A6A6IPL0_9PLEO|nr:uncharacterized protein BU26DRAFT_252374 [Trematosphaeria pertusa]KAF2252177.1 hypothetical protein BU26DRAFT_252374 [Trematosphaeria pertusa]
MRPLMLSHAGSDTTCTCMFVLISFLQKLWLQGCLLHLPGFENMNLSSLCLLSSRDGFGVGGASMAGSICWLCAGRGF